jgi:Zn finger protein HypA/HybF involved in hydrogenase expression
LTELPNADAEKAYGIIRENLVRYQTPLTAIPGTTIAGTTVSPQIITREVVKVRCNSCSKLMDENATQCPFCGAKQ